MTGTFAEWLVRYWANPKLGYAGEREEKDELFSLDLQGDSPVLKEVHSFDFFLSASEMPAKLGCFESEVRLICEEDR